MNKRIDSGSDVGSGEIQVIDRVGVILRLFSTSGQVIRASDLIDALGVGKATAHRYLSSLEKIGLLRRSRLGQYRLGWLAVKIGALSLPTAHMIELAAKRMQALAELIHETVVISVWGGRGAVVAGVNEDPERVVRLSIKVGTELPVWAAQSQIFLAFSEDEVLVDEVLGEFSSRDMVRFRNTLQRVKAKGFAIRDHVFEGTRTLAVPVFDSLGEVCASVAVLGTIDRISGAEDSSQLKELVALSSDLSRELGFDAWRHNARVKDDV